MKAKKKALKELMNSMLKMAYSEEKPSKDSEQLAKAEKPPEERKDGMEKMGSKPLPADDDELEKEKSGFFKRKPAKKAEGSMTIISVRKAEPKAEGGFSEKKKKGKKRRR